MSEMLKYVSSIVEILAFDPEGNPLTEFEPPLTVCNTRYTANVVAAGGNPDNLHIGSAPLPGPWDLLETVDDAAAQQTCAPVSHLSLFGVFVPGLPNTGFSPGQVTELLPQLLEKAYLDVGDLWLEVPELGVQLPIVGVPLTGDGWELDWLGAQAGYLEGSAFPTWAGNTALTAHVYLPDGNPGPFVNLEQMQFGDQVIIHAWGQRYIYEVQEISLVRPDDLKILRHEDLDWVTLLTCREYDEGAGAYKRRLAVRAVLVRFEPEP
jgi:LPXTG-site transpeptidase (sortase) family protein